MVKAATISVVYSMVPLFQADAPAARARGAAIIEERILMVWY